MSEYKLKAAREYLLDGQYELARAILETISDDPIAKKWLAQIAAITSTEDGDLIVNVGIPQQAVILSQLDQITEIFQMQYRLFIQIGTVLITADVALIGFAMQARLSGIVLVASFLPFLFLIVMRGIGRRMIPIVYSGVLLEVEVLGRRNGMITTFISYLMTTQYVDKLLQIAKIEDEGLRRTHLAKLMLPFSSYMRWVEIALILIVLGQLLAALLLNVSYGWDVF